MNYKRLLIYSLVVAAVFMLSENDLLAVKDGGDKGLQTSADNLVTLLNSNLAPVVLICGCLAGAALSLMKSTPAPFVMSVVITIGFGFARSWIGSTYAVLV